MSIRRRAAGNIVVQWAEKGAVVALRLISFIVIARALTASDLGQYSLVTAMATLFLFLTDFGLDDTLVKIMANRPRHKGRLLADLAVLKLGLSLLAIGLMIGGLAILQYDGEVIRLAGVASLYIVSGSMIAVATAYFRVGLRMQYVAAGSVASAAAFAAAVSVVAYRGGGLLLFVAAWSASSLVNLLIVGGFFLRDRPLRRETFELKEWQTISLAALPLGLAFLLSNVYSSVDVVILSRLADFEAAGIYSAAYKFIHVGVMFPFVLVSTVFPLMARYWKTDRDRLRQLAQQMFDYLVLLALPIATGMWLLAPRAMEFLFRRPEYTDGALALQLLGIALGVMCISILASQLLVATENQKAILWLSVAGVVTNIGLNLPLVPKYGYLAPAIATIATEIVVLVPALALVSRVLKMRWSLHILPKALAVSIACGTAILLTNSLALPWQLLALLVVYPVALVATHAVNPQSLLSVLKADSADEPWLIGEAQ